MPERKTHAAFDGSSTTMCGRPIESSTLEDLSSTGRQIITCLSCCRAFEYHYGDGE